MPNGDGDHLQESILDRVS